MPKTLTNFDIVLNNQEIMSGIKANIRLKGMKWSLFRMNTWAMFIKLVCKIAPFQVEVDIETE